MKILILVLAGLVVSTGCARVQVQAPNEPIKLDISMRLDVYQHVEQDIDAIENIVSGSSGEPQSKVYQNIFDFFVTDAYAVEGLSPEVEQAALRRKGRLSELAFQQSQGIVGENKSGLVEIRISDKADAAVQALVQKENSDRMVIYQGVARKNGTAVTEVQKLYAKRLQGDAPGGTPVEVWDDASGTSRWKIK